MKIKIKKIPSILKLVLLVVIIIYIGFGIYLGNITKNIMASAFECCAAVENNPYCDIISDENYNRFIHRRLLDYSNPDANYKYRLYTPLVIHWFVGANVWIYYSDEFTINNHFRSASRDVPVKFSLELKDMHWKIINVHEDP